MSVEGYLKSRAELSGIIDQMRAIGNYLAVAANAMQRAEIDFSFSNQPIGLPAEVVMSNRSRNLDADQWPTVEKIMKLLERYHQLRSTVRSEWGSIPPDQQSGLKAPDDLLGRGGRGPSW